MHLWAMSGEPAVPVGEGSKVLCKEHGQADTRILGYPWDLVHAGVFSEPWFLQR